MASLYKQQSASLYKTFGLMSIFMIVLIAVGWGASYYFGTPIILYVVVGIAIVINIASYWFSDKVVIKITGAKPITRKEYFDYWNFVENLCIRLGVPMPKLYIINDESPNAFATGRSPAHSAVVVTKGLLDMLEPNELEGVLAHELAHIQNRDTLLMTAVVVMFGIVTILLDLMVRMAFLGGGRDKNPLMIAGVVAAYILLPIILIIVRMAISRQREYQADATAAIYTRYPEGLASALQKIKSAAIPMKKADSSTAHLFIASPLAGKKKFNFGGLFDTHPPIDKRIAALKMESVKEE